MESGRRGTRLGGVAPRCSRLNDAARQHEARTGAREFFVSAFRAIAGALASCIALASAAPALAQAPQQDDLAVLYGIRLDGAQVAIDVVSSGCTDASHFSARLDQEGADTFRLSIIRQKQDRCRMAVHIVTLTVELPSGPKPEQAKFILVNTLANPGGLTRSPP